MPLNGLAWKLRRDARFAHLSSPLLLVRALSAHEMDDKCAGVFLYSLAEESDKKAKAAAKAAAAAK